MRIVCSWCRQEGKPELVGEKAPLDYARETPGICVLHRRAVEARWQVSIQTVSRSGAATGLSSALFRWTGLLNTNQEDSPVGQANLLVDQPEVTFRFSPEAS